MPKISTYNAAETPTGGESILGIQASAPAVRFVIGTHLPYLGADGKIPETYIPNISGLGDMVKATYDPANKEEQVLTIGDLLDEDTMVSNSATKAPTQQSTKAYVDAEVTTLESAIALKANTADLGDSATLDVGTTAGTVAAGDDSRFTDSREWTAATVSQAEAEAGVATTRRAWTAERIAQAIDALGGPPVITGVAEPTVNDDSGDGYEVGQLWAFNGQLWILTDATVAAAVWLALSAEDSFSANMTAFLIDLPNGTVWSTHGGADDTFVPAFRENIGEGAAVLNEGAFLPVAAEPGITIVSDATYTIDAADFAKHLHFSHATPVITVGTQAAETYGPSFYALLTGDNAFVVTFDTAVDGNGQAASSWDVTAVPGCVGITRKGDDDWLIIGNTTIV